MCTFQGVVFFCRNKLDPSQLRSCGQKRRGPIFQNGINRQDLGSRTLNRIASKPIKMCTFQGVVFLCRNKLDPSQLRSCDQKRRGPIFQNGVNRQDLGSRTLNRIASKPIKMCTFQGVLFLCRNKLDPSQLREVKATSIVYATATSVSTAPRDWLKTKFQRFHL